MVTIEDKLKLFSKIVFDKIDEELKSEFVAFQSEKEEILRNEEDKVNKEREREINAIKKKAEVKKREIISKAKIEKQKDILKLKENMIDSLLEELIMKLKEYTQCEDYKKYLYKEINLALTQFKNDQFILYLNKQDYEKYKEEIKCKILNSNVSIEETKEDVIGGFILQDKDMKYRIDNTLLNK
ncbi:hypothetical protein CTM_23704, partial [Clostridium tetanomorphum DSM 665]